MLFGRGPDSTPEGPACPRAVLVEFPDLEAARACYHDPDYTEAARYMSKACDRELVIIDGL